MWNAKFGGFKLDLAPQYNATVAQPSSASNNGCFTSELSFHDTSKPPQVYHGNYNSDLAAGEYCHEPEYFHYLLLFLITYDYF